MKEANVGAMRQWQRALSPVALILLWQAGSRWGFIPPHILAAPSQILGTFWSLLASGELEHHLLVSLGRVVEGVVVGGGIGAALALIAGVSRTGEILIDAPVQMLRTLPFLALIPLFILWFGIGETPKVALVALAAAFPIYLTLYSGIRGVDVKLIDLSRVLDLSRWQQIRHVILPGALPSALVGLRFALGVSWLSLVAAEQVNASAGIGYLMMQARDFLQTDVIVVGLLVYAFLGLAVDSLVRALEHYLLAWRPSFVRS
jgi:sulfonate transport system permease protein